jgi:ribosome-binding factor A
MKVKRTQRVSEEIKKIVAGLLLNGTKDPRIPKLTSITHVETTGDYRFVFIYISAYDSNLSDTEIVDALNKAKGFFRREIGKELKLRYTPEPVFKEDSSIKNGIRMSQIIDGLGKG